MKKEDTRKVEKKNEMSELEGRKARIKRRKERSQISKAFSSRPLQVISSKCAALR